MAIFWWISPYFSGKFPKGFSFFSFCFPFVRGYEQFFFHFLVFKFVFSFTFRFTLKLSLKLHWMEKDVFKNSEEEDEKAKQKRKAIFWFNIHFATVFNLNVCVCVSKDLWKHAIFHVYLPEWRWIKGEKKEWWNQRWKEQKWREKV